MWKIFVDWLIYKALGLSHTSKLAEALNFFIYDTVKIIFLLAVIIFMVAIVRSFFPPERTKKILSHFPEKIGNVLASLLGIVTPFCSCSAVPLFIGFVEAGIPLGVTFSFLIASPMVNEVAIIMLCGLFGWKIAIVYVFSGLIIAIISGIVMGKLQLERFIEDDVYKTSFINQAIIAQNWKERIAYAKGYSLSILYKVWLYVVIGIAIGALIHGYAPADFLLQITGKDNILAVPLAVLIGIPLYSNVAGIIPIINVMLEKGMAIGTALAFMMAVTAISLPEAIILHKVLKLPLLILFFSIVAIGIIITGYMFNLIL